MNIKSHALHQIAANYIAGKNLNIEIKGNKLQTECFNSLLEVSKQLKTCLDNQSDIDKTQKLIEQKKELTKNFQNLTGITWYL
tara:strand:+ start:510 stop:758 length:249 start_codon:yes stop_codon:yes gene_type:complete